MYDNNYSPAPHSDDELMICIENGNYAELDILREDIESQRFMINQGLN